MMRIVVVGAGGQGSYLAAMLSLAGTGVTLVARGGRLEEIRRSGITVVTAGAEPRTTRPTVVGSAIEAESIADIIILAVKTYDLVEAARQAAPLVGPQTHLMTIQNGVAAPDLVAGLFREERVIAGVSYMRALVQGSGVINAGGVSGGLEVGGLRGVGADVVDGVVAALAEGGVAARRRDDIRTALWEKLLVICVTGGVMAYERSSLGPVLATEEGRGRIRRVIEEAAAVAVAGGTPLPGDAADRAFEFVTTRVAPDATSSMLEDLLAGRRLELEWLNGEIVRRGRELGIPTPANLEICEALAPYAGGSGP